MNEVTSLMGQRLKLAAVKLRGLGFGVVEVKDQLVISPHGMTEPTATIVSRSDKLLLSVALDSYSQDVCEIAVTVASCGPVGMGEEFFFDGKDTHFGEEAYEAAMLDEMRREEEQRQLFRAELNDEASN